MTALSSHRDMLRHHPLILSTFPHGDNRKKSFSIHFALSPTKPQYLVLWITIIHNVLKVLKNMAPSPGKGIAAKVFFMLR